MARVSFEDVKRVGIALGWVVLFYIVAFGAVYGLTQLLPARWNDTLAFDPIALIESESNPADSKSFASGWRRISSAVSSTRIRGPSSAGAVPRLGLGFTASRSAW